MLLCQQQPVAQQAGSPVEGALGRNAGQLRKIIAFREMPEDDVGCLAVVLGFEVGGCGLVGEVSDAGKDALLDGPGVGAVAEHLQVMIGFEQEQVNLFQLGFDVGRDVAEVGCDSHAHALGLEDEADGVCGVMRNGEWADGDVADLERLAGLKELDGREPGGVFFRGSLCGNRLWFCWRRGGCQFYVFGIAFFSAGGIGFGHACSRLLAALLKPLGVGHLFARREPANPRAVGAFGEVDRNAQFAGGDGEAGDVVGMLVGDDDGVEGGWVFAGFAHTAEEFAAAKAGVDEDSRIAAGDNGAVALGARRQYCEPHHELRIPRWAVQYEDSG